MRTQEQQVIEFFADAPRALSVFESAQAAIGAAFPTAVLRVQKTQINFDDPHMFACCSLPIRKVKGWPDVCVVLSFVLPYEVQDARIAVCAPVRLERFTHHVLLTDSAGIDAQVIGWLLDAHGLMKVMRHRRK